MAPIRVETGPMFSGKSSTLVEGIKRRLIGNQKQGRDFLAFNHKDDKRYGKEIIASHKGENVIAIPIETSKELLEILFDLPKKRDLKPNDIKKEYLQLKVLYLDEAQFFDKDLGKTLKIIENLFHQHPKRKNPLEIHAAGLDLDFRGEPFGPMPDLLARADEVNKHTAVCTTCGENNARHTQRLINGKPASVDEPIVLVGGEESYTARCSLHHEIKKGDGKRK